MTTSDGRSVSPRILAIMGSGETAPTMARVHRALFDRLGDGHVPAVIIDTPYGFQENADLLSERTIEFFRTSVGRDLGVASYRSSDADPVAAATALARIREASFVMAGPGSPSYALRHWAGGPIPELLGSKLETGGVVVVASAAALTLGVLTIPVYEIYKVGEAPRWLEGLDILGRATGLRAAVVPHFDNAEGGNHDTRFCYLGERRLRVLEDLLPDGTFILGVDSHTALLLDLDRRVASVSGLGGVTVRVRGRSTFLPNGSELPIEAIAEAARELDAGQEHGGEPGPGPGPYFAIDATDRGAPRSEVRVPRPAPAHEARILEAAFDEALTAGDTRAAVGALLELDSWISQRRRAGEDGPDLDAAGVAFRTLVVRLGEAAERGTWDLRTILGPVVTALLDLRARARAASDWTTADFVRDRLLEAGVEVRDDADASSWRVPASDPR